MESKRILFANVPFDGHFNPLTGLAVYLKNQGHDVRWYTGSIYAEKLKKMNIHHYRFKHMMELNQFNLDEIFSKRVQIRNQVKKLKYDIQNCFILRSPEYFEDIKEINKEWEFDAL